MSCIHLLYCDKSHYQNFTPPFDIPESWQWVKIDEIASSNIGLTYSPQDIVDDGVPVYRSNNIRDNKICLDDIVYVSCPILEKQYLNNGDLLICARNGSRRLVGKNVIIENLERPTSFGAFMAVCRSCYNPWIKLLLDSAYFNSYLDESNSTAINQITQKMLLDFILPLPPKEEQSRIISAFHSIVGVIDGIDQSKKNLSESIANLKSKILDLAMQGKLVPQDPADEPAAEMLRRVNPKAKIITDNPQCRNLPLGWTLCQLRDLCSFLSRGKSPKYSETPNQYPVFAQKCNLKDGDISLTQARFLDENTISKWPEKYRLRDGDVLVNSTGTGTVGRTRMFKSEYLGNYPFVVPDSHVSVVRSFDEIDSTYIFYCLYCQDGQQYFAENLAGSTNQKELYIDVIGDKSIMLPPINEQKRIVAKIEEQYSVLYEIEASLRS